MLHPMTVHVWHCLYKMVRYEHNKKQKYFYGIITFFFLQHPVSDTLETVQYNGLRQTVSTNGGIIVSVCIATVKNHKLYLILLLIICLS